jgi:uncharacterized protein (DUF1778 family)
MSKTASTARLEARLTPYVHALIKRAAELEGRSVTDFVVTAVEKAAKQSIADYEIFSATLEDQAFFARMLIDPPEPNSALKRAAARHRKLVRSV